MASCKRERYWGRGGAGMLFVCSADETMLLLLRASWVAQGGTWGIPGGAVGEGWHDTPIVPLKGDRQFLSTALREVREECGSMPRGFNATKQIVDSTEYEDCGFRYVTYVVDLTPAQKGAWDLVSNDGETDEFQWFPQRAIRRGVELDGARLHFGVEHTLSQSKLWRW